MHERRDILLGFGLAVLAFITMISYNPVEDTYFTSGQAILPPTKLSHYATRMYTEPVVDGIIEQSKGRLVASSDSSPVYLNFAIVTLQGGDICELSQPPKTLPCGEYLLLSITNDEDIEYIELVGAQAQVIAMNNNQAELLVPSKGKTSLDIQIRINDGVTNTIPTKGKINIALID